MEVAILRFYKKMINSGKSGLALVELLAVMGVSMLLALAIGNVFLTTQHQEAQTAFELAVQTTLNQYIAALQDQNSWRQTYLDAANPSLNCLNTVPCGTTNDNNFYPINKLWMPDLQPASAVSLGPTLAPNQGYTVTGQACNTYNVGPDFDACPYQFNLSWRSDSSGNPISNTTPISTVQITLNYKTTSTYSHMTFAFNASKYGGGNGATANPKYVYIPFANQAGNFQMNPTLAAGRVVYTSGANTASGGTLYWANAINSLGINVAGPAAPLDVAISPAAAGVVAQFTSTAGNSCTIDPAVGFSCSSDRRLKEDIQTVDNALDKLSKVRGVSFLWKNLPETRKRTIGFIAQELEKVFPEFVGETPKGYKLISYGPFVAILTNAINELHAKFLQAVSRIDSHESEIAELKKETAEIDARIEVLEKVLQHQ